MIFWLFLVGLVTYIIVRQSVAGVTRTPVWLLWLVMMTPAFVWTGWALAHGTDRPIPAALALPPFIACPLLYIFLVQRGRTSRPSKPEGQGDRALEREGAAAEAGAGSNRLAADPKSPLEALALAKAAGGRPPRLLDREDEARLQDCFPWSVYYLRDVEHRPQAAICRGQLRTAPEEAYRTIRDNIRQKFSDRFLLVFQEGQNGKPFFALVPNPQGAKPATADSGPIPEPRRGASLRPGLALALLVVTLLTTTYVGAELAAGGGDPAARDWVFFQSGLPYGLAIVFILAAHEFAHYLAARAYQIPISLPCFLPVPAFLGTFGAYAQLRAPVPHRKALFDLGLAGPLAGLAASLPLFLWGLTQSSAIAAPPETASLLNPDAMTPQASMGFWLLSKAVLGAALDGAAAIDLHPVAVAGYAGVWLSVLHLVPIGRLDGGHIVHAMLGQRAGATIGQITRLLVLVLALARAEYLVLALLLFFIPAIDDPALNDVTPLDDRRDFLGLLALVLVAIALLPPPPMLLGWMG